MQRASVCRTHVISPQCISAQNHSRKLPAFLSVVSVLCAPDHLCTCVLHGIFLDISLSHFRLVFLFLLSSFELTLSALQTLTAYDFFLVLC
jgi:hypothetical protein